MRRTALGTLPGVFMDVGGLAAEALSGGNGNGSPLIGTSNCMRPQAGVPSIRGSQVRELRVRPGAHRGARLRDGVRSFAESPRRFYRFLRPVRACVARVQRCGRIESGFNDRRDLRRRKHRGASRRRAEIPRRNGRAADAAGGALGLPSPFASASTGRLLIRNRKGSRSRRARERRSPPVRCIWSLIP